MKLQILKETDRHRYRWKDSDDIAVEFTLTRNGHIEYHHMIDRESDDSRWRVGTTGLSPEDADHVWQWYTDVYETASANDNRSRGVCAFFERAVLFPRRMAIEHTQCQKPGEAALRADWAQWVIDRGITFADGDRTALLIEEEGSTVPIPRQQDGHT